jgi:hypothetical protein
VGLKQKKRNQSLTTKSSQTQWQKKNSTVPSRT